jgi:hypothetical protein
MERFFDLERGRRLLGETDRLVRRRTLRPSWAHPREGYSSNGSVSHEPRMDHLSLGAAVEKRPVATDVDRHIRALEKISNRARRGLKARIAPP